MKQTIKTLALITAGLVVGAAIGRGKKVKPSVDINIMDLPEVRDLLNLIKNQVF
ncbi:hypothetical protein [Eremococcus coleocola]|uniref:hypothetical protein n=1 Tax=Eremococcus coleocola TaxID=88132 RepID=UPI00040A49DB|nr:hypothetical protein [Eremococcus coleocola]